MVDPNEGKKKIFMYLKSSIIEKLDKGWL